MIAKNEAALLDSCLRSLSGQVDEILLVDTGSTDETVTIAERFGCRVSHFPWNNDFAKARNYGLEQVRTDWILYIDADERLSCSNGSSLESLIPGKQAAAARVKFYPRPDTSAYFEYRLFRNDPRIRFVGSMHETMLPGIVQMCAEDDLIIDDIEEIVLTHHGYEGDLTAKHNRNLPLLQQAILEDPKRVYLRYHIGATLKELGRTDEAVTHLEMGVRLATADRSSLDSLVQGSMCAQVLFQISFEQGNAGEALRNAETGIELYNDNQALRLAKAKSLLKLGREREALASAQPLADIDLETFFDPKIAYPKSLFETECHDLLGFLAFKLEDYEKAAFYYNRGAQFAADPREFTAKAAMSRARASARSSKN